MYTVHANAIHTHTHTHTHTHYIHIILYTWYTSYIHINPYCNVLNT